MNISQSLKVHLNRVLYNHNIKETKPMNTKAVEISDKALKDLRKIEPYIIRKLRTWIKTVNKIGLMNTRKLKGYHDEPLQGNRKGQRSIRLNKAYRAIYEEHDNGDIELSYIEVVEVNKHKY